MSARLSFYEDKSIPDSEKVARLREMNDSLADSLRRLSSFQKQVLAIKQSHGVEEALDQMELLLDNAVEFVYARLYLTGDEGKLQKHREMGPEDLEVDWSLVEWACNTQELAVIPVEEPGADESIRSLLLLPLAGHTGTQGMLVLWLDSDPTKFTQEQSTLLTMLSRETAAVIETHRFRESLEAARAEMEDVVESVPHGIMQVDRDGRIALVNSNIEFMLNLRRAEAVGASFREVFGPDIANVIDSLVYGGLTEEQEINVQLRGIDEIFGLTATPMRTAPDREPESHLIICRDLKLSREVMKLRELDAMKNDFLSLVSHELRTPLTSIMAYSETLLMEGMVETEEERREYLQIIYDEGARLSRLINDVLDLTKMEAGKMEYVFNDQDINSIIENAIASSSSLAQQKGVELVLDLGESLPAVKADSDRIMQVLMNFLSNAIKFTDSGGKITVASRLTPPEEGKNVETMTVSVADTGCGIAPENLDKVFSKFEQIENINHHHVGTGLGMPICQQIIEDGHAGKIWIESQLGVGSTVFFRIPVS